MRRHQQEDDKHDNRGEIASDNPLTKEEEHELDVSDCFNPAWQLDALVNSVVGRPEDPSDVAAAINSLTAWRKRQIANVT